MMFQGVASSIRYCDPEFYRFVMRLKWFYLIRRFTEFNIVLTAHVKTFEDAMKKAADAVGHLTRALSKESS